MVTGIVSEKMENSYAILFAIMKENPVHPVVNTSQSPVKMATGGVMMSSHNAQPLVNIVPKIN
jgi:hypothetical protein